MDYGRQFKLKNKITGKYYSNLGMETWDINKAIIFSEKEVSNLSLFMKNTYELIHI